MSAVTIPCPRRYRRIHDRVLARDLEWFARHPGETQFDRVYVPGEAWPVTAETLGDVDRVRVYLLRPGFRARAYYNSAKGGPVSEEVT